jgi:hypothetical protein
MNPSIAPIDFVKDIKVSSSIWMKKSKLFPAFNGWAVGYGSFTCSYMDINRLIEYIKNQHEHHQRISFEEEYRKLLLDCGITPDEKFFPLLIYSAPSELQSVVVIYPWLRQGLFIFGSFRAAIVALPQ